MPFSWLALLLFALLPSSHAAFTINTGTNVVADGGSSGTAPSGTYNSTADNSYNWYANGGVITGSYSTIINSGNVSGTGSVAGLLATGSGSRIDVTNLDVQTSGSRGHGVWSGTNGTINIKDSTISTSEYGGHALYASGSNAAITGSNLQISAGGKNADGVLATGGGVININDSRITTQGGVGVVVDGGIWAYGTEADANGSTIHASGLDVTSDWTTGDNYQHEGLLAQNGGKLYIDNSTVRVSGSSGYGVGALFIGAYVSGSNLDITTTGNSGHGAYVSGALGSRSGIMELSDSRITTNGSNSYGVASSGSTGLFRGDNVTVNTTGVGSGGLHVWRGGAIEMTNSHITSEQSHGIMVQYNSDVDDPTRVSLTGGSLSAEKGNLVSVYSVAESTSFTHTEISLDSVATANGDNVLRVYNAGSGVAIDTQVDFTVKNSAIKGAIVTDSGAIADVTLDNNTQWSITGDSNMNTLLNQNSNIRFDSNNAGFHTLTTDSYTSNGGSLTLNTALGDDSSETDKLVVTDSVNGSTTIIINNKGGAGGQTVNGIQVVEVESNSLAGDEFTLGNKVGAGMYNYLLDVRDNGAWLVSDRNSISEGGGAVLNTAAALSGFWFTQLDNLNKRMGELRYNTPSKGNLVENVWVRSYGQQANMNLGIEGVSGFSETQYGVDFGTDKAWIFDDNNTLYTGVFAGYGGADRDFHSGYDGSTDSGYGGLYGTWINQDGWYADAVAKGQYFSSSFDGDDHGSYDSVGVGVSLELGRQFRFADGWFAEPSVQVGYVHLMNDNYRTRNGMAVDLDDSDVIQFYGGSRFGRNIKLGDKGWLQPYVKVGGLQQVSSGGKVRADDGQWRPNIDGARGVIGAGIVYQLDDRNQLHLEYEASFGDKYDKPWGLNFGYRHQF
jgi:outer membrane autotransporter protein